MILLLLALQVRLLAGEVFGGSGKCPSEYYNEMVEVDPKVDCYFPTEHMKVFDKMFCDEHNQPANAIRIQPAFDKVNWFCPYPSGEKEYLCKNCLHWSWAVGCAKMKGGGHKYSKFLKDVPIDFDAIWHNKIKTGDDFEEREAKQWEPVRAWVGCAMKEDEIHAIEIYIKAPSPTCIDGVEGGNKYLPYQFLRDVAADVHSIEKLTISANLAGLHIGGDGEAQIPPLTGLESDGFYGLKELDISENAFGYHDGWPMWNFYDGRTSWDKLLKLDMSYNGLTSPYPNMFVKSGIEGYGNAEQAIWHHMTSLTHLNLSGNRMTAMSPCTFGCIVPESELSMYDIITPNLKILDLSNNELDGDAFRGVYLLRPNNNNGDKRVMLKSSEIFKNMGKLRVINLANNNMDYLPPKIFAMRSLKNLKSVDLRGNPLECLPLVPKMPGDPREAIWNADGPFFWDGGEKPTCEEVPPRAGERLAEAMESIVDVQKLWIAVPAVAVFAGIAIALSKPNKSEVFDTLA